MRIPLEFIGRVSTARPKFSKFKKVNVIFFNNLREKKILKRGVLVMPFHAGHYDYTKDIKELFIQSMKINTFVSRETLKKSKTFVYHIYLFK